MSQSIKRISALIVVALLISGGFLVFVSQRQQDRSWTVEDVVRQMERDVLRMKDITTDATRLPLNLQFQVPNPCREHITFTILDIPHNQLFVCETRSQFVDLALKAQQGAEPRAHYLHNMRAGVILLLNPDLKEGVVMLYRIGIEKLGMQYLGPMAQ